MLHLRSDKNDAGEICGYNQEMHELIDEIKYSQRKTMAIEVKPGGKVIVRAPKGTRKNTIQQFVQQKSGWIAQAKDRMIKISPAEVKQQYHDGAQILYLGHLWKLQLVDKVKGGLKFNAEEGFQLQKDRLDEAADLIKNFYREETRRLVSVYIDQYASKWGLKVIDLRITSAKTRWGSCSAKNGLNFSYRLAMVPLDALEYVVVHELVHTRHHNHSTAFWGFVAQMMPGFQKRRQWLKLNGRKLPSI
jgi:hypothetical protein